MDILRAGRSGIDRGFGTTILVVLLAISGVGLLAVLLIGATSARTLRFEAHQAELLGRLRQSLVLTSEYAGSMVSMSHGTDPVPGGDEHAMAPLNSDAHDEPDDHERLDEHWELKAEVDEFIAAGTALRDTGDSPSQVAHLLVLHSRYVDSIDELHEGPDGRTSMETYHTATQEIEAAVSHALLELRRANSSALNAAIEAATVADRWLWWLGPGLFGLAVIAAGSLIRAGHRRQSDEIATLTSVNTSKDRFLASVSHELRTPLTAVVGFLELLDEVTEKEERHEMVRLAAREAHDLSNIVNDLLVVARVDEGLLEVVQVRTNVAAQVRQVLETTPLDTDGVRFDSQGDQYALADPGRVRQIVRNLVSNALKYGGDQVVIRLNSGGETIALTVCDNGEGVPADLAEVIMKPYGRAHSVVGTTESIGLGLFVSLRLSQAMGGDLAYERQDGLTCFRLVLPRYRHVVTSDAETVPASSSNRVR